MSEFECKKGHLMKPGEYICSICGEKISKMDGLSNNEIRKLGDIENYDMEEIEKEEDIDNS